jgi:ATP-dependent 26S proteasome regulatory subunit
MSDVSTLDWTAANQRYLTLSLGRVAALFEPRAGEQGGPAPDEELRALAAAMPAPPALEMLCTFFGLSPFERDVLLLCAGMELDSRFPGLVAASGALTFSLALAGLPDAHWSAITPAAPLRYWRFIELAAGPSLTQSPLRIDERILHYLTGTGYVDDRLAGYLEPVRATGDLVPSHRAVVEQIVSAWSRVLDGVPLPVIQLYGMDALARQQVAVAAGRTFGLSVSSMRADTLPENPAEAGALLHLWEREAILGNQLLYLNCEDADSPRPLRRMENTRFPLILSSRERVPFQGRPVLSLEVHRPAQPEQRDLWQRSLGEAAAGLNGRLDSLVANFDLDAQSIESISGSVLQMGAASGEELGDALWRTCRTRTDPRLGELAQRIQPMATWDDLVLPETQTQILREVAVHIRRRMVVYDAWGFAAKSSRGLGISALFSGVSGTGKTMAAEVLANDLRLDLYRIDLSQVVSKYIGETEKNLRRVFDTAEEGGAILLFDEADALFGKRSEVKDSHDRYANVEVSYLLQRMEAYRGLAILTTNLKEAIDTAFMRRIRFVVQFPFPDAAQRAEIWRRVFPAQTPTSSLDAERLARLAVAGGNIRNIALYAAFLAADEDQPVRMSHLLRAARAEYAKLEKPLSEAEIGGWE